MVYVEFLLFRDIHTCKRPTSFRRVVARLPLLELTDPATVNKETTRCGYNP